MTKYTEKAFEELSIIECTKGIGGRHSFLYGAPMSFLPPQSAFSARALACRRGGRLIFANLSFRLEPGRALVLRGPNGSGKTSLLRQLAGLTPLEAGAISWLDSDNTPDDEEDYRTRLHYAGHALALKSALTVRGNLLFWARYLGGDSANLSSALQKLDLKPLADIPVGSLSAGQQRRVSLARLLMAHRPLWLLDEPTIALDHETRGRLVDMITDHLDQGGMAVIATHVDPGVSGTTLDMLTYRTDPTDSQSDMFMDKGWASYDWTSDETSDSLVAASRANTRQDP